MRVIDNIVCDLFMHMFIFFHNATIQPSSETTLDFSLLVYAGLLQSFCPHEPSPFRTIVCKLAFRSTSIQLNNQWIEPSVLICRYFRSIDTSNVIKTLQSKLKSYQSVF